MTTPKLILFNGPRHSGKDTASLYCEHTLGAHHFKMSGPIKAAAKAFFSLSDDEVDYLEQIKTTPSFLLFGVSYVDLQISMSEDWAKKKFDQYIFGKLAARSVSAHIKSSPNQELYVCSDSGFESEAWPVIDIFGKENTLLVKIHRNGKDFSGDSRSYIELDGIQTIDLINNKDVGSYYDSIKSLIEDWTGSQVS